MLLTLWTIQRGRPSFLSLPKLLRIASGPVWGSFRRWVLRALPVRVTGWAILRQNYWISRHFRVVRVRGEGVLSDSCGSIWSWRWHFCGCWGFVPFALDWRACGSGAGSAPLRFLAVLGRGVRGWVGRSLLGSPPRTMLLVRPVRRVRGIDRCSRLFCGRCLWASPAAVLLATPKRHSILISSYYISIQNQRKYNSPRNKVYAC